MKTFNFRLMPVDRVWNEAILNGLREMIDGGIGYWCTDFSEEESELPVLFVVEEHETLHGMPGPQTYTIDLATVASGINRILSGECPVNTATVGNVAAFIATNDLQYLDSEDADLIVQAGLYNDIKWG